MILNVIIRTDEEILLKVENAPTVPRVGEYVYFTDSQWATFYRKFPGLDEHLNEDCQVSSVNWTFSVGKMTATVFLDMEYPRSHSRG